jgi:hypothetical protein
MMVMAVGIGAQTARAKIMVVLGKHILGSFGTKVS